MNGVRSIPSNSSSSTGSSPSLGIPFVGRRLSRWTATLSAIERAELTSFHLGECLDLTKVVLNYSFLEAAARFWIPSLGVFRFGSVELSPSLEEVSKLTGLPLFRDISVLPPGPVGEDLFTHLFNANPRRYDLAAPSESPAISLDLFYEDFSVLREHPGTPRGIACRNALILGILAEILLPSDVFLKLQLLSYVHLAILKKPLVPSILAGIHEGLTRFHEGASPLQGCLSVLQVWLMEHLGCIPPIPEHMVHLPYLTSTLLSLEWTPLPADLLSHLSNLSEGRVCWKASWLFVDPLVCYGDYKCLTLLGVSGYCSYNPQRFLRQFGIFQCVPIMSGAYTKFTEYSGAAITDEILNGWYFSLSATELGLTFTRLPESSLNYRNWLAAEMGDMVPEVPEVPQDAEAETIEIGVPMTIPPHLEAQIQDLRMQISSLASSIGQLSDALTSIREVLSQYEISLEPRLTATTQAPPLN